MIDVAVVEDVWGPALEALRARFSVVHEATAWSSPTELSELVKDARALVVRNRTSVTRSLLEHGVRLEVVARAGVGTDNIDLSAADDLGIVVVTATAANARSVAEHTLCLALALARDLIGVDRRTRGGQWERRLAVELAGRTWGVVGLGATGTAVAMLAASLGLHVIAYDPYLSAGAGSLPDCRLVNDLIEVASDADVVSLHVPLTPETDGLVGRKFLAHMRPGAYLINVARGGLVDEEALADALDAGRLAGAGLDVRVHEPPKLGRIETHENVILTSHVAGMTEEAQEAVVTMLADDLNRVLSGTTASHAVGRWSRRHHA